MVNNPPFVYGLKLVVGDAVSTTTGAVPTLALTPTLVADGQLAEDTTTLYLKVDCTAVNPVSVRELNVADAILLYVAPPSVLTCHWYVNNVPLATTLNVAVVLHEVISCGCVIMAGAAPTFTTIPTLAPSQPVVVWLT